MDVLAVASGAIVGAIARWQITTVAKQHNVSPWTTFCINVVGSFILGAITARQQQLLPNVVLLLGTGFCGSFTTLSTFSVDTLKFIQANDFISAVILVIATNLFGIGAAGAGYYAFRVT